MADGLASEPSTIWSLPFPFEAREEHFRQSEEPTIADGFASTTTDDFE